MFRILQEVMMQNSPYVKDESSGKKAWCACGLSENQPYCDGSHARSDSGKLPVVVDIPEDKKVAWCGCRKTQTPPFCDGSHAKE